MPYRELVEDVEKFKVVSEKIRKPACMSRLFL